MFECPTAYVRAAVLLLALIFSKRDSRVQFCRVVFIIMVVSGKIYTPKSYHKTLRAQLAAAYTNASLEVVNYCPGESALPNEVKNCPAGVAPLFHSKDGVTLFDANAIAYFLGNKQLRGTLQKGSIIF